MLCVARRTLWSRLSSLLPVAVAALAGCAGGAVAPPRQPHALSLDRARSAALPLAERQRRQFAYVPRESIHAGPQINGPYVNTAQYYGSDAVVYGVSPAGLKRVPRGHGLTLTYLETITSGLTNPQGSVATATGDWYIVSSGSATIPVYHFTGSGPVGPTETLSDPGEEPVERRFDRE